MIKEMSFVKHRDIIGQCSLARELDWQCRSELGQAYDLSQAMIRCYGDTRSCYPRVGRNTIGGHNLGLEAVDPTAHASLHLLDFATITDQRLDYLAKKLDDCPWLVCWSGGIDSTVIIASCLRNLHKPDLEKITVFCNLDSIWLAPRFYTEFIKPNFNVLDSTGFDIASRVQNWHVIDGDLADYLWPSRYAYQLGVDGQYKWQRDPGALIDFFSNKLQDRSLAKLFVQAIGDNIGTTSFTGETNADFLWWINFNFKYQDGVMRKHYRNHHLDFDKIETGYTNWYHDQGYNTWSLLNAEKNNRNLDISQHKICAKKYIQKLYGNRSDLDSMVKIAAGSKEHLRHADADWIAMDQQHHFVKTVREVFFQ